MVEILLMTIPKNFSFDQKCSKFFTYQDFFECSDTFKKVECSNLPRQGDTIKAIAALAVNIMDKVVEEFGNLQLTYGFCSPELSKVIPKNIYPKLDQHAGHEIKKNGMHICERLGFASDFIVPDVSSLIVGRYIVSNLEFDRLYFYGGNSPIHVSLTDSPVRSIVLMNMHGDRRVPQVVSEAKFLTDL